MRAPAARSRAGAPESSAYNAGMIYGYLRVSTAGQTVENQRFEIESFCRSRGWRVRRWVAETVCGAAKVEERELGRALAKMRRGDVLIATELSRLGRNLMQVMSLLNACFERGVRVLAVKENYELGDNLGSKILAFAFSLCAELERQLISQRTTEALARLKAEGKKLGRPPGRKNRKTKLSGREAFIAEQLSAGVSKMSLSRRLGVHRHTLDRAIKAFVPAPRRQISSIPSERKYS